MKRQRTNNKLSKLQRTVLGENCPEDIYSAELGELYAKFDGHLLHDELDLCQTYEDFVLAGRIGHTNSDGTGRFNLEPNRVTIGILPLFSKPPTPPVMKMINDLLLLLPTFFPTIRGELCAEKLVMKKKSIVDAEQGVEFPIRTNKQRQLDAFAVLDVVEEYVKPHMFHIIAITDLPLFDPEADDDGGAIFGRANGNRTCVVHYELSKEKLCINTCVHESLHCMGFDHCSAWRCIMNPCLEEGDDDAVEFTLCPAELRKLMSMQSKVTVKQRFEALLGAFQQLSGYEAEIDWLERVLLQL